MARRLQPFLATYRLDALSTRTSRAKHCSQVLGAPEGRVHTSGAACTRNIRTLCTAWDCNARGISGFNTGEYVAVPEVLWGSILSIIGVVQVFRDPALLIF